MVKAGLPPERGAGGAAARVAPFRSVSDTVPLGTLPAVTISRALH
jgi:hypothetical protein